MQKKIQKGGEIGTEILRLGVRILSCVSILAAQLHFCMAGNFVTSQVWEYFSSPRSKYMDSLCPECKLPGHLIIFVDFLPSS